MSFKEKLQEIFPAFAARNISLLTSFNLLTYLTGFFYSVIIVRWLGAFQYGQLLIVISIAKLLKTVVFMKLPYQIVNPLRRTMEREQEESYSGFFTAGLSLQGFSAFVGLTVLVVSIAVEQWFNFFDFPWLYYVLIFFSSIILKQVRSLVMSIFKVNQLFGNFSFVQASTSGIKDFVPLLFLPLGIKGLFIGYIVSELLNISLVLFILLAPFAGAKAKLPALKTSWEYLKSLFNQSWNYYLAKLYGNSLSEVDNILMASLIGSKGLGFFDIGIKFFKVFDPMFKGIRNYLFPRLIQKIETNAEEFVYTVKKYLWMTTSVVTIMGIIMGFVVPYLIPLFYGTEFYPSVWVFLIILPGMIISKPIGGIFRELCFAHDRVRIYKIRSFVINSIYIVTLAILTWFYGLFGVAFSRLVTRILGFGYNAYYAADIVKSIKSKANQRT